MAQVQKPQIPPKATILSFEGGAWKKNEPAFNRKEVAGLIPPQPDKSYIFLHRDDYPPIGTDREALLEYFGAPLYIANRACTDMNGYFGCRASYDDEGKATTCSTWFRCLVKMVRKESEPKNCHEDEPEYVKSSKARKKGYVWFEMGIFTFWDGKICKVLCVDTPDDLPDRLKGALEKRSSPLEFSDPFAMHTDLLDQIILYYEISAWRVRDPVRKLEESRNRLIENVFKEMHDISRHAIHTSEILSVTIDTMTELQRCQTDIHESLPNDLKNSYKSQAKAYTNFQIQLMKSLKLRSESNQKRLENEVNLAFNNLAHQDNTVMKSIALLTMVFFPATFLSSLFSTTFFTFGENGWEASPRLWIYWAIAAPVTIAILVVYILWVFFTRLLDFVKMRSEGAELL